MTSKAEQLAAILEEAAVEQGNTSEALEAVEVLKKHVDWLVEHELDQKHVLCKSTENLLLQAGLKAGPALRLKMLFPSPAAHVDNRELENIRKMLEPIRHACSESLSTTMSASRATKEKIRTIEQALHVIPGPMEEVAELLGVPPSEGSPRFDWDGGFQATEDQLRNDYANKIKRELNERAGRQRGFQWFDARRTTLRRSFTGVPFPVSGKNDEVLILQSYHGAPELGAILGVELKKKLTWQAIYQMEAEFYLWSAASVVPYVQSVTDLNRGGVVCYLDSSDGKKVLRYKAFLTMSDFFDYLAFVIKSLPPAKDLTSGPSSYPDELSAPKRMKLMVTGNANAQGSITREGLWKMLWDMQQEERDVACLEDVERLEDWGVGLTPLPSYIG